MLVTPLSARPDLSDLCRSRTAGAAAPVTVIGSSYSILSAQVVQRKQSSVAVLLETPRETFAGEGQESANSHVFVGVGSVTFEPDSNNRRSLPTLNSV